MKSSLIYNERVTYHTSIFSLLASEEAMGVFKRVLNDLAVSHHVIFTPFCSCPNHLAWGKPLPHRINSHCHFIIKYDGNVHKMHHCGLGEKHLQGRNLLV